MIFKVEKFDKSSNYEVMTINVETMTSYLILFM